MMTPSMIESARAAHEARAARQYARLRRIIGTVAVAVLIALSLRSFVLEPFNIPSASMLPTLRVGDYLFVAKWPYGYSRFSLPLGMPVMDGRIGGAMPERGDVVVFKSPADNRADFIKRVVGLPGDRVRMTGGRLEINGVLVPKVADGAGRFIETLGTRSYAVLDQIARRSTRRHPAGQRCRRAVISCWATTVTTAPTAASPSRMAGSGWCPMPTSSAAPR